MVVGVAMIGAIPATIAAIGSWRNSNEIRALSDRVSNDLGDVRMQVAQWLDEHTCDGHGGHIRVSVTRPGRRDVAPGPAT